MLLIAVVIVVLCCYHTMYLSTSSLYMNTGPVNGRNKKPTYFALTEYMKSILTTKKLS